MLRITNVPFPELALVAITRAFLGAGIALLVADRIETRPRRSIGFVLASVGAIATIPLLIDILRRRDRFDSSPSKRNKKARRA